MENEDKQLIKEIKDNRYSGRFSHKFLMSKSFEILKEKGFEVKIEHILPNKKRIDVFGVKGKEKIGVECLVRPSLNQVTEKKKMYSKYCDKLIIAFPDIYMPKFPIESMIEVFKINIPNHNNNPYETLSVEAEDKTMFVKLNSDWNILNPKLRRNRSEFFKMMMNNFKEQLKKEMKQ